MKQTGPDTTVNPFESPLRTEPSTRLPQTGDWQDQRGRGPVSMFFIGAIMGGIVAAVAGAVGAAMLSVIVGLFGHTVENSVGLAIIGPVVGGFTGGCAGIPFGAILGVVYGFCKARSRRWLGLWTCGISALIGASVGWMGGQMLANMRSPEIFSTSTGILCGCSTGIVGGWLLARLLEVICWGLAPTRP